MSKKPRTLLMSVPVIVTGLSGAGISSVLKALEDFRFEVFDNMPVAMVGDLLRQTKDARVAIGLDTRTRGFTPKAVENLVQDLGAKLLFITSDDSVLQKRFTETRRRHPLAQDKSVAQGIKAEKALLEPLRARADYVIDSSETSVHDLRHILEGYFAVSPDENLIITLMSFGFRHGIPREADIVMDVRFLKNPHWEKDLKAKTGKQKVVGAYIEKDHMFEDFIRHFKGLIKPLLPRYAMEGKSYLTIAIGCTGGKHRSVYTVEVLKDWFATQGYTLYVEHRDIPE